CWSGRSIASLAVAGALSVWFSHPAAFVLAGVGAALIWQAWVAQPGGSQRVGSAVLVVAWSASFIVVYAVSLRHLSRDPGLHQYWQNGFVPYGPRAINWFLRANVGAFRSPGGFLAAALAGVIATVGA